jgi:acetylornithine/LysW-gamma-L-lysine aminotransferase
MDIQTIESEYTSGIYSKREIILSHGRGALLYDINGNEYIDCVGGQGTANIGHTHPKITQAVTAQIQNLNICPEIFYNEQRAKFLEQLTGQFQNMSRAFLCNSGTEANEAAIKFARFSTKRTKIIAAMRGFHGRTYGALSATWNKHYRAPFAPLVPGYTHVPYNNLEKLVEAVDDETAAVLLEVVQGEGGVHPATTEFPKGAQEICNERGALLIIDEVQTGFGRTGKLFAYMHHDIQPDMVCLGKSIAGGIPMGAVILGENVAKLSPGIHGTTFGGNPIACAAGLATLEIIRDEKLVEQAATKGSYIHAELEKINSSLIREVRGMGLMIGIELKTKVAPYLSKLGENGILALPAGMTVIRLLPPLVISESQIDQVVLNVKQVLQDS